MRRDESWLQALLDDVWDTSFSDVEQGNDVRIVFGRRARRRLGSIALDPHDRTTSVITMNGLFRLAEVPEFVVRATLVHELCHYAHGFNSPLAQRFAKPHAGGVMRREYAERGLLSLYLQQKRWLKAHWPALLERELPRKPAGRRTSRQSVAPGVQLNVLHPPRPFWWPRGL